MRTLILTLALALSSCSAAIAAHFGFSDKPLSDVEKNWIRNGLGLPDSTPITFVKSKELPSADPLKLYIPAKVTEEERKEVLHWVGKWNAGEGAKYGTVKVVTDISGADVIGMLVVVRPNIPAGGSFGFALPYLISRTQDGFNVIWRGEGTRDRDVLLKELKKRIKARVRLSGE